MRSLHKRIRYVYLSVVTTVSLCSIALTQVKMVHADTVDTTEQSGDTVIKAVVEEGKADHDADSENINEKATTKGIITEESDDSLSDTNANSTEANSASPERETSASGVSAVSSSAASSSSTVTKTQSSNFSHTQSSSSTSSTATSKVAAPDRKSVSGSETATKTKTAKVAAVGSRSKVNSTKLVKKNGKCTGTIQRLISMLKVSIRMISKMRLTTMILPVQRW